MEKILFSTQELDPMGFIIRTLLVGVMLFILAKFLPRRSGGQYAGYDFAFFWMMGGLMASPLFDSKIGFDSTIVAVVTIYAMHYLISHLVVKSRSLARLIIGTPIVVVAGGKINRANMFKALLPVEILLSELRSVNAPNLNEVEFAVMETSGHVSVIKKSDHQPVTLKDLNIPAVESGLPVILINEGQLLYENLTRLGLSEEWLKGEIQKQGALNFNDVYLASLDGSGTLHYSLANYS